MARFDPGTLTSLHSALVPRINARIRPLKHSLGVPKPFRP